MTRTISPVSKILVFKLMACSWDLKVINMPIMPCRTSWKTSASVIFFGFLLSFNELPRTIYVHGPRITLPYYLWTESAAHSTQVAFVYALSAIITAVSLVLTTVAIGLLMRGERN